MGWINRHKDCPFITLEREDAENILFMLKGISNKISSSNPEDILDYCIKIFGNKSISIKRLDDILEGECYDHSELKPEKRTNHEGIYFLESKINKYDINQTEKNLMRMIIDCKYDIINTFHTIESSDNTKELYFAMIHLQIMGYVNIVEIKETFSWEQKKIFDNIGPIRYIGYLYLRATDNMFVECNHKNYHEDYNESALTMFKYEYLQYCNH